MPRAGSSPYRRPTGSAQVLSSQPRSGQPGYSGPPRTAAPRRPMLPDYEELDNYDELDQDGYDGWGTPPSRPPGSYPPDRRPAGPRPGGPPTGDIYAIGPDEPPDEPPPRGRYNGKRRRENPWASYGLIVAVPLVLVLLIVGFSALPPYTPSKAQSQPNATVTAGPSSPSSGSAGKPKGSGAGDASTVSYEAENPIDNQLGPTTKIRTVPDASGGQVVTSVGHGTPAGDVRFKNVTAPKAGKYTVTVYYATTDAKSHRIALFVNTGGPKIFTFPGLPDPNKVGSYKMTVTLTAGTNTLRYSNATKAYGPDLDRITVQPA
jgi:hypothetical protein